MPRWLWNAHEASTDGMTICIFMTYNAKFAATYLLRDLFVSRLIGIYACKRAILSELGLLQGRLTLCVQLTKTSKLRTLGIREKGIKGMFTVPSLKTSWAWNEEWFGLMTGQLTKGDGWIDCPAFRTSREPTMERIITFICKCTTDSTVDTHNTRLFGKQFCLSCPRSWSDIRMVREANTNIIIIS